MSNNATTGAPKDMHWSVSGSRLQVKPLLPSMVGSFAASDLVRCGGCHQVFVAWPGCDELLSSVALRSAARGSVELCERDGPRGPPGAARPPSGAKTGPAEHRLFG